MAPTGSQLNSQFQQQMGASPPNFDGAALTLNGMSDADIEAEIRALAPALHAPLFVGALRTMLMWPPPHRVTDTIHRVNGAAARQGRLDYFRQALAASQWHQIVVTLNGFSDPDIVSMLTQPALPTPQLVQIRDAAQQHMAGWNRRVVGPISTILQGATANEMAGLVGSKATWTGSGPGSGNTFEIWASATSEGAAPPVQPSTRINCWEMVLLAAHRARTISWQWIHQTYTASGAATGGDWGRYLAGRLTPSARQTYARGNPAGPAPRRGDIVMWNGASHVGMAVGVRDGAGRVQVYSFWPPPGTAFIRGGTLDAVKVVTIEELADFMDANGLGPVLVEFGPGPW